MGDDADGLRIILSGGVRIWISDQDGQELTVALLEKGDSFGEIALFDELPRTASATATENTECLYVPRSVADTLLKQNPDFAKQIIQILCETLRRNTKEMSAVMFLNLEKRLAQKLCDLAFTHARIEDNKACFNRKFSQADLAKMLGVSREAINKRLTNFAQQGLIEVKGGKLSILDVARLSDFK